MSEQKLEAYFFTVLLVAVLLLVGYLFYPFLGALALAFVLAVLAMPIYDWLNKKKRRPNTNAFIVVLLVTLVVLLPAIGLLVLLVDEAASIAYAASNFDFASVSSVAHGVYARVTEILPMLSDINLSDMTQRVMEMVGTGAAAAVTETLGAILKTFVAIVALFFFIRDGHVFVDSLVKLSPLADDEDHQIVSKLRIVTHSLIRGTMAVALLQGVLMGLGFVLFGVPNPVLWGSVAAVSALVPTLGTGIVAFPTFLFLLLSGNYAAAIGFLAWSLLVVGLVDNIIGPKLIGGGARIHPLFILLSVLGGLAAFGLAGFFLGPLIFGLLVALSEIYKVKIQEIHESSGIA